MIESYRVEQVRQINGAIDTAEERRREAKINGDIREATYQWEVIVMLTRRLRNYI